MWIYCQINWQWDIYYVGWYHLVIAHSILMHSQGNRKWIGHSQQHSETSKPWTSSTHKCPQVSSSRLAEHCLCCSANDWSTVAETAPKEWDAMSRQIPTRSQRCPGGDALWKIQTSYESLLHFVVILHWSALMDFVRNWESLKASNSLQTPMFIPVDLLVCTSNLKVSTHLLCGWDLWEQPSTT